MYSSVHYDSTHLYFYSIIVYATWWILAIMRRLDHQPTAALENEQFSSCFELLRHLK